MWFYNADTPKPKPPSPATTHELTTTVHSSYAPAAAGYVPRLALGPWSQEALPRLTFRPPLLPLFFFTMSAPADSAQPLASTSNDQVPTSADINTSDASRGQSASASASASELARTKITLQGALKSFQDFPIPGINFIDILPLFQDPAIHNALLRALELQVLEFVGSLKPDVVVGLDARGFLFGPSLALKLDASFVPVRKKGKMPGPCVTAAYEKEYGTDFFQMQEGAIKPGQKVLVVDDIIATGTFFLN